MTAEQVEARLADLVAFQCCLLGLRGVAPDFSEETIWQTLAAFLREQYGFDRVNFVRSDGMELAPSTAASDESDEQIPDVELSVWIERRLEGRLQIRGTELSPERREQIELLLDEASAIAAEGRFRRASAEALREARIKAEAASRAKSMLLANMSHEIRTPMNGIIGMTQLALQTPLSPVQREYLETVESSAGSLLRILDDILDYSRAESGKLQIVASDFDLRNCVAAVLDGFAVAARERGLALLLDIDDAIPAWLVGDDARLRQVLGNLVGNALKFTDSGEVWVQARLKSETDGVSLVHLLVADTGIGIPREKQELVFAPFEQADTSIARKFGGTGLGLAIVSNLVQLMGGRVWVESPWTPRGSKTAIEGTAFHVVLPFRTGKPTHGTDPAETSKGLHALRILLAEDNMVNRKLAQRLLEHQGHHVMAAEDGQEALRMLERNPVDVVLMDVQMPGMDGLEATRTIREREAGGGKHLPIVALTAHAMAGDREECLAAGMDAYVSKPIQVRELLRVLQELAGTEAEPY